LKYKKDGTFKLLSKTFGPGSRDLTNDLNSEIVERKDTANFGSTEEIFVKQSFKKSKDILMNTFAGKKAKLFFYT
jgi:hypothetical protein